ncbi:MAG TPA: TonB-dependent receptor [Gemmatimonadales bacterium]|jgi:iron complex outermembrane receptor protein
MREIELGSLSLVYRCRRALHGSAVLAAALLTPLGIASAQDPDAVRGAVGEAALFEEVPSVTAASKYEQDPREAPASISVITHDDIQRYGYRTLAEALNSVRGFFTSYDRNYTYVAVRGFTLPGDYNTRILLLVDGHRLNDNIADAAYFGTESAIDLSAVDRVEIIRGAASSLYGTNAFYAVVNLITRSGRSLQGGEVRADAGTFGSYRARGLYGRRAPSGVEYVLGGGFYRTNGPNLYFPEFDSPATNGGIAAGLDGDRTADAFGKITYQGWSLEAGLQGRRKEVPTASYETTFDDPRLTTRDGHTFAVAKYDHPFADLSRVNFSLAFDRHRYTGTYPYDGVLQRDLQSGDWWTLDAQYVRPIGQRHKLVFGGEYRLNTRQDQQLYDEEPFYSYLDDRRDSHVWALFLQDEFRLARSLLLNAGVRHDSYETFGGTTNPRAALIWTVDQATTLKALYGRAFRAPNLYELYAQDGGLTQKPSPSLRPETIASYELVAERQLSRALRGSVSVYHFDAERLIGLTTDPADSLLVFGNLSRVRSTGVEVETEGTFGSVTARASYALQRVRDVAMDLAPVNSPTHVGRFGLSVPFLSDRARLSGEARFLSERRTVADDRVPAYGIVNLTLLAQPVRNGLEVMASIYNLFDHSFADPGGEELVQDRVVQDGRVVRAGARYQF